MNALSNENLSDVSLETGEIAVTEQPVNNDTRPEQEETATTLAALEIASEDDTAVVAEDEELLDTLAPVDPEPFEIEEETTEVLTEEELLDILAPVDPEPFETEEEATEVLTEEELLDILAPVDPEPFETEEETAEIATEEELLDILAPVDPEPFETEEETAEIATEEELLDTLAPVDPEVTEGDEELPAGEGDGPRGSNAGIAEGEGNGQRGPRGQEKSQDSAPRDAAQAGPDSLELTDTVTVDDEEIDAVDQLAIDAFDILEADAPVIDDAAVDGTEELLFAPEQDVDTDVDDAELAEDGDVQGPRPAQTEEATDDAALDDAEDDVVVAEEDVVSDEQQLFDALGASEEGAFEPMFGAPEDVDVTDELLALIETGEVAPNEAADYFVGVDVADASDDLLDVSFVTDDLSL